LIHHAPALPPFFMKVETDEARALGANLTNVNYAWDATKSKYTVSLSLKDASFSCSEASKSVNGTMQETHDCRIEGDDNSTTPQPSNVVYADFSNNDAKLVFNAMKTTGKRIDTFTTGKIEAGPMRISCERTGIPPGAQGMPGPTSYWCTAVMTSGPTNFPPGAQGMPAPALPPFFMSSKTQTAAALGKNLTNVNYTYDSTRKRYVVTLNLTDGSFVCTSKSSGPNMKNEYNCKVSDGK
jgi:hypothetical protein